MQSRFNLFVAVVVLLAITISASVFFVDERERVILLKLGQIERADYEPGLHFKIPFVNQVRRFDGRVLSLDATPARYLTGEKKNVIVDSFILWRISDVAQYFRAMSGDEENAKLRLSQIIKDGLRAEFGRRSIQEVVSGDRDVMVAGLMEEANETAEGFGIEIVNVRI